MIIKFSSDYPKLHGQTTAELLAVKPIRIDKDTPKELLEYDTKMQMIREGIDECERRLEEIAKYNQREDV